MLGLRSWVTGAQATDLPGTRVQAELRTGRWRWAARGDVYGVAGSYQHGKLETVRSGEVHVAVARDLGAVQGITAGPAVAVGSGAALEAKDGLRPRFEKRVTAGIGARVSGPNWWAYAVVGQHRSLRGVAATVTWQARVSDRVANVGLVACGSRACIATTGVAVRWR